MKIPPLIHSARVAAEQTEKKFASAVEAQKNQAMELNDKHIQYNVLSRKMEINQALYEGILTRLKESKVATGIEQRMCIFSKPRRCRCNRSGHANRARWQSL